MAVTLGPNGILLPGDSNPQRQPEGIVKVGITSSPSNDFSAGSGFGIQPVFTQSAYFRYGNKARETKGLYFVGASTHPGAGVPGVLSTAKVTEKLIVRDYGDNK